MGLFLVVVVVVVVVLLLVVCFLLYLWGNDYEKLVCKFHLRRSTGNRGKKKIFVQIKRPRQFVSVVWVPENNFYLENTTREILQNSGIFCDLLKLHQINHQRITDDFFDVIQKEVRIIRAICAKSHTLHGKLPRDLHKYNKPYWLCCRGERDTGRSVHNTIINKTLQL